MYGHFLAVLLGILVVFSYAPGIVKLPAFLLAIYSIARLVTWREK